MLNPITFKLSYLIDLDSQQETAHKQTRSEQPFHENPRKTVGKAGIQRRPTLTPVPPRKKKVTSSKKKYTRH